ncbi:hypothetical protein TCE0_042r15067 [Talaromyces pinophilus]|jgi:hypothetical protein|uniref:Uncharacterized protein n=1 Tax=Talaromyces pinophilus TaxID=128442 RepID=A0A6V8HK45_TALPI|nr:hypothetical protein TCE0_042r15067 [Talaromyces pinophilus]
MAAEPLLVPVQLHAFALNPAVCGEADDDCARITPITQPNYTFLRLDNFLIQYDVQNHVDFHNTAPAKRNSRMYDLGPQEPVPRRNRHGVYVHWMVPRAYRDGTTASDSGPERRYQERTRRGLATANSDGQTKASSNTPEYIQPPTRWIVIRKIEKNTIEPSAAKDEFKEYKAWVIESDYRWELDDIPEDFDLQVDVSPFVVGQAGEDVKIMQQAEVFIGRKTPLEDWIKAPKSKLDPLNISLLRSSNQLFADFQLHNANVFSMLDNFQYGESSPPKYLQKATCSYYLLGWHWTDELDPLSRPYGDYTHKDRMETLFMDLKDSGVPEVQEWLKSQESVRLACHGAMYDVKWNHEKKPADVPADAFSRRLQNKELSCISVGTTPMDALITYCQARKDKSGDPQKIEKLQESILCIESLLYARDDGVEEQRQAKDTINQWNFSRASGGTHYFIGGESVEGKPTEPNPDAIKALQELNEYQALLDSCTRTCQQYRWDMFSTWWKYVSDVSNKDREKMDPIFEKQATAISNHIIAMEKRIADLQNHITELLPDSETRREKPLKNAKAGTQPFFYRGRDPTVLVGGIDAGWPSDYLDTTAVRLRSQVIQPKSTLPKDLSSIIDYMKDVLPAALTPAGAALVSEFYALDPMNGNLDDPPSAKRYPQFHDTVDGRWRDQWGDWQPWFPLYAEWEVEYTHVPFHYWDIDEHTARLSEGRLNRYGIKVPSGKPLYEELGDPKTHDVRMLSGRALILPQPSFSLAAKVQQLFEDTPPKILDKYLNESRRKELIGNIKTLSYLSFPLSGLIDGLATQARGSHIKPENKEFDEYGKETSIPINAAVNEKAGFTKETIGHIANNSDLTPFASLARFTDSKYCPFKPVTHGQFRFRKLNIVDRFGQALVAIDPRPRIEGPPPLYPAISHFYEPQLTKDKEANTVLKNPCCHCDFIQLPPQINQEARLNAAFVSRTADGPNPPTIPDPAYWRPSTEWENPVWGWIVANYADYGIQLFLKDGTFYREVRIGGPNGTLKGPKWVPFAPDAQTQDSPQLDALVDKLANPEYLDGFWKMITVALDSLPPAPESYAQYLNSIVGKPLALVNMGWSLEIAGPPLRNQSTKSTVEDPNLWLLPDPEDPRKESYSFQVKLGDKEREYDGLVGYFDVKKGPLTKGIELDLERIHTYFAPNKPETPRDPRQLLSTDSYPSFQPFWEPPFPTKPPFDKPDSPESYNARRDKQLHVYGAIVDPFTAVHGYTSFLPTHELKLPTWTWQDAMNTMTAFLHSGPLNITEDVRMYDPNQPLTTVTMKNRPPNNVSIPSLGAGEWNWLQPYVDQGEEEEEEEVPVFNAYGVEKKGNILEPAFQKGPYTAIEGFLQLRQPIMVEKPPNSQA